MWGLERCFCRQIPVKNGPWIKVMYGSSEVQIYDCAQRDLTDRGKEAHTTLNHLCTFANRSLDKHRLLGKQKRLFFYFLKFSIKDWALVPEGEYVRFTAWNITLKLFFTRMLKRWISKGLFQAGTQNCVLGLRSTVLVFFFFLIICYFHFNQSSYLMYNGRDISL